MPIYDSGCGLFFVVYLVGLVICHPAYGRGIGSRGRRRKPTDITVIQKNFRPQGRKKKGRAQEKRGSEPKSLFPRRGVEIQLQQLRLVQASPCSHFGGSMATGDFNPHKHLLSTISNQQSASP